ncbi:hypothetical protein VNN36_08025 [Lactococcus garvieae]|uniref:hypothetical protein n=1 Tax=Lactococcus garvieae TaxID=1363 RepID=UPI0030CEF193
MAERTMNLIVVEIWQYGKVIFKGNSQEVKEHFDFSSKQFARLTAMGKAVQKGSAPRPQTMYAIKIGEEKVLVPYQAKGKCDSINRGKETKEEQRLRRRIQRDMIREEFYNGNNEAIL